MNILVVRYLPSWFPGMSFKRGMAEARAYSKVYLDRPFAHSLQKLVMISPDTYFVHTLNNR